MSSEKRAWRSKALLRCARACAKVAAMRTRKTKSESASKGATESTAPLSQATEATAANSETVKTNERISFYIDDNGLPQWDRISPKTVDQLRAIFESKDSHKKLGIAPPPDTKEAYEVGFDATEANALLDLLQIVKAYGASKAFDVPVDITTKAFTDTELQRSKMVPPIAKLMNKWGPSLLKTWKDEIGAGIIFVAVTNAQVQVMRHLEAQRKANSPQPVTEIRNRSVSAGKETKPAPAPKPEEKAPEPDNPVLDALNASA